MSWHSIVVRHDTGFLRITERRLIDHLVDALNEFEKEHGPIEKIHIVQHEEDKFAELIVKTEGLD